MADFLVSPITCMTTDFFHSVHGAWQCERELVLYGYVRGSHLKPGMKVHLIGAGDFDMASVRAAKRNAECLLARLLVASIVG